MLPNSLLYDCVPYRLQQLDIHKTLVGCLWIVPSSYRQVVVSFGLVALWSPSILHNVTIVPTRPNMPHVAMLFLNRGFDSTAVIMPVSTFLMRASGLALAFVKEYAKQESVRMWATYSIVPEQASVR